MHYAVVSFIFALPLSTKLSASDPLLPAGNDRKGKGCGNTQQYGHNGAENGAEREISPFTAGRGEEGNAAPQAEAVSVFAVCKCMTCFWQEENQTFSPSLDYTRRTHHTSPETCTLVWFNKHAQLLLW